MSELMIQVQNLTKDYGATRAVDGVTFNVRKGEVLGFLGPNGAGKSTTMKMLTCFLAPTGGTAKVAGFDVYDQSLEVRKRLGYLPEDTPIYRDMTVVEHLRSATELRAREKGSRYRVVVEANGVPQETIKARLVSISGVLRCERVATEDGAFGFSIDAASSDDLRKALFRTAVENRWTLLELVRESAS